jgi:hypothetical protein
MPIDTRPPAETFPPLQRARNVPGRVSLALGLVIVLVGTLQQIMSLMIPFIMQHFALPATSVGMLFVPFMALNGLLGLIAVVFGIIGLTRPNLPRGAAAAGTALGGHAMLSIAVVGIISLARILA